MQTTSTTTSSVATPAPRAPSGAAPLPPPFVREGFLECRDPATGERLGEVPALDDTAVRERVARARAAQAAWGRTSFHERRRVLRRLLDTIVARQEEIARVCVRDSGKTMVDAAMGEIFPVCEKIRYLLAHGERDLAPEPRASGILAHKAARVEYRPLGVVGVIAPWNFPFHNLLCPTVPALFAGSAVVAKVSEWTAFSAAFFQELFDEVLGGEGFAPALVQVITGAADTGRALVQSGVDKVFFTGSPENGRRVMAAAAETLTPVVLELGGKDPMIICDDADLARATDSAMLGVFTHAGQMCVAAERLYVFDAVYDRFVGLVEARVRALRQGPPSADPGGQFDVGALTMPRQVDIVERQVRDAIGRGARALAGGRRNPALAGSFFEPTVLVDVDHTMAIAREETFGPVMTIVRVRDEDEAVRLANDSAYGLGSSVFTRSRERGERLARRLRAGMTVVNDYGIAYMMQAAPFGGVGISGFGRINGREGLRACCHVHTVVTDRLPIALPLSFYPVRRETFSALEGVVGTIYGRGLARARSAVRVLGNLRSLLGGGPGPG